MGIKRTLSRNAKKWSQATFNELLHKINLMTMLHFPSGSYNDDMGCESCSDFLDGHCPGQNRKGCGTIMDCMSFKVDIDLGFEVGTTRHTLRSLADCGCQLPGEFLQ